MYRNPSTVGKYIQIFSPKDHIHKILFCFKSNIAI